MAANRPSLYIIDGHALLYRAFHAIRDLTSASGEPTNAIFGFIRLLTTLREKFSPEYLAVAFDAREKTFRHKLSPAYKATRAEIPGTLPPQITAVKDFLTLCNITLLEYPGFEADDIIASLVSIFSQDVPIVIVSNDKDVHQLVSDRVSCLALQKGLSEFELRGPEQVRAKFGIGPAQIGDWLALTGDSSDNIKGAPGIGAKTAQQLLLRHQTIEDAYRYFTELQKRLNQLPKASDRKSLLKEEDAVLKSEKKIAAFLAARDTVRQSQELVNLRNDLTLPAKLSSYAWHHYDHAGVAQFLQRYGLRSLADKWSGAVELPLFAEEPAPAPSRPATLQLSLRRPPQQLFLYMAEDSWWLSDGKKITTLNAGPDEPGWQAFWQSSGRRLVGYRLKKVWKQCRQLGPGPELYDIRLAAYLLDPSYGTGKLAAMARHLLQKDIVISHPDQGLQALEDIYAHLQAHPPPSELWHLEQRLLPLLGQMELTGIAVDLPYLQELRGRYQQQLEALAKEAAGYTQAEINLNSPKQLAHLLFNELGLKHGKKTNKKTAFSTSAEVLEKLRGQHPIIDVILEHRQISKLQSTYVEGLLSAADARGIVKTSFNQTATTTGRLSSSEPNLQNIPVRHTAGLEIRQAFIPRKKNHVLLAADYSQIELRVMAHVADEPRLIEAFRQGHDIHTATAAEVFNVALGDVSREQRRQAKVVNFGIMYGMSAFGLARDLGITRKEAKTFIDMYFDRYPGIRQWLDTTIATAKEAGVVQTLTGRQRFMTELQDRNPATRQFGERAAINMPIQGTAADIIKMAMLAVAPIVPDHAAELLLQVHDELIFEVPEKHAAALSDAIRPIMENVMPLAVPLTVDIAWGENWCALSRNK